MTRFKPSLYLLLILLTGFLGPSSYAADNIQVQGGKQGKAYLLDSLARFWPATIVYTTDGNGNVVPITGGGGGGSLGGSVLANQGSPSLIASAWPVRLTNGTTGVGVSSAGRLLIDAGTASIAVTAASLPLPDGAATEGTLASTLATLGSIAQRTPALGQAVRAGSSPVTLASDQPPILVAGTLSVPFPGTQAVSVASLPLPAGAATESTLAQVSSASGSIALSAASIDLKTPTQGQKLAAASSPVVLASDQTSIPVAASQVGAPWSVSFATPQAVIGTLGVTQVGPFVTSGTQSINNFPAVQTVNGTLGSSQVGTWSTRAQDGNGNILTSQLSGAQRALDVGIVVNGVQIDPRQVSGTLAVSTKIPTTGSAPASVTLGTVSAQIVAANTSRRGLVLQNNSTNSVALAFGATAVTNSGIVLRPGGSFQMDEYMFSTQAINGIATAGTTAVSIQEFVQ